MRTVLAEQPGGLDREGFAHFVAETEPALRRALAAAYGAQVGRDATADALA